MIEQILIENYKSIRNAKIRLNSLNVLIGSNGVGKSNFISFFELVQAMLNQRLGSYILSRGGIERMLYQGRKQSDFIRSLIDFKKWSVKSSHIGQVEEMERCIKDDIKNVRFIPYIQLHEFEALLFASNEGFNSFFDEIQKEKAQQIINSYDNPEDINTTPEGAPSKRILAIKEDYDKVLEGNLIALEIGFSKIMKKCTRFRAWIEKLIEQCKES